MIKGIIFDLDGTLLDTIGDLHNSMNNMLKMYSYPEVDRQKIIDSIGHGADDFVHDCLPEDKRQFTEEYLQIYMKILNNCGLKNTILFDGIKDILTYLNNNNYKLAILSNKPQKPTEIACEKFLKDFKFDYITGQKENDLPKPDATVLKKVIKKLELNNDEVVMIGDGEADILVAKNGDIKQIAVLWGYRTKEQLKDVGAVNFAQNTKELLDLIQNI
jgi:phosphoglycolate phosphatase